MYAGGANFTSLFFMNVYRIYLYCLICFYPFFDDWQKGGEVFDEFIYACMNVSCIFLFYTKRGRRILRVYICMFIFLFNAYMFCLYKKGRSIGRVYLYLFPHLYIYVVFGLSNSLNIFMFIAMHELRGSFYEA